MDTLRNVAAAALVAVGAVLALVGCEAAYKLAGLPPEKVAEQVAKDQTAMVDVIEQSRETLWQIATVVVGGVGAIISGLLAKWLGVEKAVSKAVITGVEVAGNGDVKKVIAQQASAAGVESALNKRVRAVGG